jgi:hypothetical protein
MAYFREKVALCEVKVTLVLPAVFSNAQVPYFGVAHCESLPCLRSRPTLSKDFLVGPEERAPFLLQAGARCFE